ncbi:unnamed protein product [Blumeria hordei]|uniref:Uncharacterized protein n=1 Tax=Blumeria hordei TaxID=2867405 RepID=A0A383UUR0_BLUHO|nr:unnamed protein product [Blumeria hordei]
MYTQKCILAFLTSFSPNLPTSKQLILVDNQETDNYNVYQIHPLGKFPSGYPPAIIKSSTEFNLRGTTSAMYCSNKMNLLEMRAFITRGMPVMTTLSAATFASREIKRKTRVCLRYLENIWNYQLSAVPQSNEFLRKSEIMMGGCSDGSLTRLAFTRFISFVEDYSCLNPNNGLERIKIQANSAIDMGQVIFDSKILKIPGPQGQEWGLAWYQYHIHIFEFDHSRDVWFPITIIGGEWNNGKVIYEALQFDSNVEEFKRRSEAIGRSDQLSNGRVPPNILTKTSSISSQYQNMRSDIIFRNFPMSVVSGSLGCRQPPEYVLPENQSLPPFAERMDLGRDIKAEKSPFQLKVKVGNSPKSHVEVNEGPYSKPSGDRHSSHQEVPLARSNKGSRSQSDGTPFQRATQTNQRRPSRESRPHYSDATHHHPDEGSHSKWGKEPFQEAEQDFYSGGGQANQREPSRESLLQYNVAPHHHPEYHDPGHHDAGEGSQSKWGKRPVQEVDEDFYSGVPVDKKGGGSDSDTSYDGEFYAGYDDVPHSHPHEETGSQPIIEFGEGAYMNRMSRTHQQAYHRDNPGHSQENYD